MNFCVSYMELFLVYIFGFLTGIILYYFGETVVWKIIEYFTDKEKKDE